MVKGWEIKRIYIYTYVNHIYIDLMVGFNIDTCSFHQTCLQRFLHSGVTVDLCVTLGF